MTTDGQQANAKADEAKTDLAAAARDFASNPSAENDQRLGDAYQTSSEAHSAARPVNGGSGSGA
ncbi:hypothetical protein ACQPZP_00140 [Spirillospora sp. CA-142024]|uniref:hypothetical protein n=1 Tax=Spirillospora sp. CA-142024 TaxID=3240036 RepID=UPI003D8BB2A9